MKVKVIKTHWKTTYIGALNSEIEMKDTTANTLMGVGVVIPVPPKVKAVKPIVVEKEEAKEEVKKVKTAKTKE